MREEGMGYEPGRPRPAGADAEEAARVFQLQPKEARRIMERLRGACFELPEIMEQAELNDADRRLIDRVFWRPD